MEFETGREPLELRLKRLVAEMKIRTRRPARQSNRSAGHVPSARARSGETPASQNELSPMKIAVFLPNWLGDVAMATPALRAVRRHFGPQARHRRNPASLSGRRVGGHSWLDEQWFFDPRSKDRSRRAWAVVRRMRAEAFDMAVLMTNSIRTAWVAWLGGAETTDRLCPLRPRPAADRQALSSPGRPPDRAGADGRDLPGNGPGGRLRRGVAPARAGHRRGRRAIGRRGVRAAGFARRRPRRGAEFEWGLRRLETLAGRILRGIGPADR